MTPTGVAHLGPGDAVGIDGGVFVAGGRQGAVVVRVDGRGATVSRPEEARRGAGPLRIAAGTEVEIPLAVPGGTSDYRRNAAWEAEAVTLRVAVAEEPRRSRLRGAVSARPWAILAAVAAVHGAALGVSGAAMPPLEVFDEEMFLFDGPSLLYPAQAETDWSYRQQPRDDRFGEAPEVCTLDRPVGHSFSVQGPADNADPHLARDASPFDELADDVIGPLRGPQGGDELAPTAPWGRDDALGTDAFSATGTAVGTVDEYPFPSCFGPRSSGSICSASSEGADEATVTLASLGLAGIGDDPGPGEAPRRRKRAARVTLGPMEVTANVPRWMVVEAVRDVVERARVCYERALVDDPGLGGRLDAVMNVRELEASFTIAMKDGFVASEGLTCCLQQVHEPQGLRLPEGTRATARYAITFGRPAAAGK